MQRKGKNIIPILQGHLRYETLPQINPHKYFCYKHRSQVNEAHIHLKELLMFLQLAALGRNYPRLIMLIGPRRNDTFTLRA